MRDEIQQNYGVMTGTPSLVTGALTNDTDQGLTFDGSTNSMTVTDSPSDSLAVGVAGGMAVECWVNFASLPGSTKTIIGKSGSYSLQITSTGHILWNLTGSGSVTATSNTVLSTNTWYHIVGVYNGGYTGTTQIGNTTQIANYQTLGGDYLRGSATTDNNLHVCRFQALESGVITQVTAVVVRTADSTLIQGLRAVVYAGTASAPGALLTEGIAGQAINPPVSPIGLVFTGLSGAFQLNDYLWIGLIGGGNSNQLMIETAASGGSHAWVHDDISGGVISPDAWTGSAVDPFGTPAGTDAENFVIWGDYTATARTGDEGNALLYVNGMEDTRAAYTGGITDTSNDLLVMSGCAGSIDEVSIWNKKLTNVQVAKHYNSR